MKLYSDTLTEADLYACLPDGVTIAAIRPMRTRKRASGWELSLEGYGTRHTRRRNSGMEGANGYGYAATWDDQGVWMAALYDRDPDALIAWYTSRHYFYEATANVAKWRQRSRFRSIRENSRAPWLDSPRGRLEHLRGEIRAERISYGEIAELQGLAESIDPDDVELLQWAGVPEFEEVDA